MNFAAPALVVGLLAVQQTYAVNTRAANALEAQINRKLATIERDLMRAEGIFQTQGRGSRAYLNIFRVLQRDFNVRIPQKDSELSRLIRRFGNRNQVQMFFAAATQRENANLINLRKFLFTTPYRPLSLR